MANKRVTPIGQRQRRRQILRFVFYESVVKTLCICFIVTFIVAILLDITPKEKEVRISIRGEIEDLREKTEEKDEMKRGFFGFYLSWIGNVVSGNLGRGKAGQKTTEEMKEKLKVTLSLACVALVPALAISFLLGLLQQVVWIKTSGKVILFFTTLPAFFLGYALIGIFGFHSSGVGNFFMAVLTLGLSSGIINEMSRVIMYAMNNEMSQDYIETARAKGLSESVFPRRGTIGFHAFRNALISILPRIGALIAFIISGSIIVEQVFSIHGLSFMLLDGLIDKDNARVLMVVLLSIVLVRLGTILSNLFYLLCNPRYGER